MAKLSLTEEEKQADSYLNWDDESLGKLVRRTALLLEDSKGLETTFAIAAAQLLVGQAARLNAAQSNFDIEGFTISETPHGDWEVVVRQVKNADGTPVDLRSQLERAESEMLRLEKFQIKPDEVSE